MPSKLTLTSVAVLHAVANGARHGFEIIDVCDTPGGTVYPALTRLEREGFLSSDWEDVEVARREKRPPRRYYQITPAGARTLNQALSRMHAMALVKTPRVRRSER
jgi:DNA-binding PadR family transcriptional regulator